MRRSLGLIGCVFLLSAADPAPSPIRFREIPLPFVLENSPTPQKHLIETMPGGIAVFDYDGDGRPDIYFTNGAEIPSLEKSSPKYWNRLYRNEGDWKFRDVTEEAGVAGAGYSMGAAAADYDNDGHADLFVAGVNRNTALPQPGQRTIRGCHREGRDRKRRVGRGRRLVRLRPRRQARPLGGALRQMVAGLRPLLRRRRAAASASTAIRNTSRGCRARCTATAATARSKMSPRAPGIAKFAGRGMSVAFARLRPGRLARRVRHERQHAEFPVPQRGQRHVRGGRAAGRSGAARPRQGGREHGRRVQGLRQRRAARHLRHRPGRRDLPAVPQRRQGQFHRCHLCVASWAAPA